MGPSGVSFACPTVAFAFAITTANFDEIEDNHQKLLCVKGKDNHQKLLCAKGVGSMH